MAHLQPSKRRQQRLGGNFNYQVIHLVEENGMFCSCPERTTLHLTRYPASHNKGPLELLADVTLPSWTDLTAVKTTERTLTTSCLSRLHSGRLVAVAAVLILIVVIIYLARRGLNQGSFSLSSPFLSFARRSLSRTLFQTRIT